MRTIRAKLVGNPYTLPDFVAPGAIPWLLLERAGIDQGPTGATR